MGKIRRYGTIKWVLKSSSSDSRRFLRSSFDPYIDFFILGECVLAIKSLVRGTKEEIVCGLTHLGDESGEIKFMYVICFLF